MDAADACATNLFDVAQGDWDNEILGIVMGDTESEISEDRETAARRLRRMLGEVERDGGKSVSFRCPPAEVVAPRPHFTLTLSQLGHISSYFVNRFGFNPGALFLAARSNPPLTPAS